MTTKKVETPANLWDAAVVIEEGTDHISKAALVGVAFLITEYYFYMNAAGAALVHITGQNRAGKVFEFADGSSGIYRQLVAFTEAGGESASIGTVYTLPVKCTFGLRASTWDITDEAAGTSRSVTTYRIARGTLR